MGATFQARIFLWRPPQRLQNFRAHALALQSANFTQHDNETMFDDTTHERQDKTRQDEAQ